MALLDRASSIDAATDEQTLKQSGPVTTTSLPAPDGGGSYSGGGSGSTGGGSGSTGGGSGSTGGGSTSTGGGSTSTGGSSTSTGGGSGSTGGGSTSTEGGSTATDEQRPTVADHEMARQGCTTCDHKDGGSSSSTRGDGMPDIPTAQPETSGLQTARPQTGESQQSTVQPAGFFPKETKALLGKVLIGALVLTVGLLGFKLA